MNTSSNNGQQASASLFCSMKSLNLVKEQEEEGGDIWIRRDDSVIDHAAYGSLLECKNRRIRKSLKSHSIQSIVSGETTQDDINQMASNFFAANCEAYYKRCIVLGKLIEADHPEDDVFMETMNSGPMYITDCCQFVNKYVNKFRKQELVKNTVLGNLIKILWDRCAPMDIYKQMPLMDVLSNYRYAIKKWGKATDALSALKNKFSIIECNMAYQIAYFEVVMLLIGDKNFNIIFGYGGAKPLVVCCNMRADKKQTLVGLLSTSAVPVNDDLTQKHIPVLNLKKGMIYYFMNHEDYLKKHPKGAGKGFNVMLVDKVDKCLYFTAFGFPGCGLTHYEIGEALLDLFNRPSFDDFNKEWKFPKSESLREKEFKELQEKTIGLDDLYANKKGWFLGQSIYLDINKIEEKFKYLVHMGANAPDVSGKSIDLLHEASPLLSWEKFETTV